MGKQTALALCLLAVAGCAAPVPDDTTSGVGFGDYDSYQAGRAAQPGATPAQTALSPGAPGGTDLAALAAAAIDEAEAGQTGQPGAGAPVATGTGPAPTGERRISDEQDFEAVSARESIESDAERRQRMQDQRVVIAPTAVPDRPGETGPNIVEYALSTGHPVGAQIYRRFPRSESRHQRNDIAGFGDQVMGRNLARGVAQRALCGRAIRHRRVMQNHKFGAQSVAARPEIGRQAHSVRAASAARRNGTGSQAQA